MTTIKVRCSTNRYASDPANLARAIKIGRCKHNGGKDVIVTLDECDVAECTVRLGMVADVVSYEVRS